jgi:hypothetical protein
MHNGFTLLFLGLDFLKFRVEGIFYIFIMIYFFKKIKVKGNLIFQTFFSFIFSLFLEKRVAR